MAMPSRMKALVQESANHKAVRGLMIGLAALVVLVVSGFGTVVYIDLMNGVFPSGPQVIACYLGAGANFLLMLVLLIGKFTWFRPGAQEVASWIVTGVEVLVCILNLILAFQMVGGPPSGFLAVWLNFAPISPVFSMVGATILLMTSVELRRRHRELELQEQKEQAERELELAFHAAEIEVKGQYLTIIKEKLTQELNAPERHQEIAAHARAMVSQVLSGLSGMQSLPAAPSSARPAQRGLGSAEEEDFSTGNLDDEWLERVNARMEQERERSRQASARVPEGDESVGRDGGPSASVYPKYGSRE